MDIETRIEELAQLRNGWLDGKGQAPERAALERLVQAFDEGGPRRDAINRSSLARQPH